MLKLKRMALYAALAFSQAKHALANFVTASGTKILDESGQELFFNGINLGNWLVWEGYLMMGDFNYRTHTGFFNSLASALGGVDKAAAFEYQWRLNYVDEKAISDLSDLGFNSVRVPFNFKLFYKNGQIVNDGFEFFDRVIGWCRQYGMYVLLDMHGAPGYQNPGDHADNVNSNANQPRDTVKFWDGGNVQLAASIWRHIANYYKDEPVVWGYDLINEPVPQSGREFELLPSYVVMRNAIREVDNNHIIVAEGSWWGSDLSKIDWEDPQVRQSTGITAKWDNNLVYQIHHYGPASGTYGREQVTQRLNIPLFIGEYGESDENNLLAITDWAKQKLEGYFPWSFKKMSHDRCLWTIPPNAAYDQVKAYINNGGTPPTQLYPDMINFAQVNIKNGHNSHVWHQGFYNAVKPTITCAESTGFVVPGTIQAEEYCGHFGTQLENTNDAGGGSNIGFLDTGDYTEYKIAVGSSGQYLFQARVASQYGTGQIDVRVGGVSLAILDVPNTNGWQSWTTISNPLSLTAGTQILRLEYPNGNFNLNWFSFSASSGNLPTKMPTTPPLTGCSAASGFIVPGQIEAENYCNQQGVELENTSDVGGGQSIGFLDAGDYVEYNIDVATSLQYSFEARVASEWTTGKMDVKIDGTTRATFSVPNTGGWQTFTTLTSTMSLTQGSHRLRLDFPEGGFNLNWIKFTTTTAGNPPTNSPTPQGTTALDSCLATNAELQAQILLLQQRLAQYEPTPPPTPTPTSSPTKSPSKSPTAPPSNAPTSNPTLKPTMKPTSQPTPLPTPQPTPQPQPVPTLMPTMKPTASPTPVPTKSPTMAPTKYVRTGAPSTTNPTPGPTKNPTMAPSPAPTKIPTPAPTLPTSGPLDCNSAAALAVPGQFEAEQYCNQMGVVVSGGLVTQISNGDYVEYKVIIAAASQYTFAARVDSAVYSGQINLQVDGVSALWLSVGHTNGTFKTVWANVWLNPGTHILKVAFPGGGFNVDWIAFNTGTNNPPP